MQYQSHTTQQCIRKRSRTTGFGPGCSGYRATARLGRPLVLFVVGASRRRAAPRSQSTGAASATPRNTYPARWLRRSVHSDWPSNSCRSCQPPVNRSPPHGVVANQMQSSAAIEGTAFGGPARIKATQCCYSLQASVRSKHQIPPPNMALQPTANGLPGLGLHFILAQTRQAAVCG